MKFIKDLIKKWKEKHNRKKEKDKLEKRYQEKLKKIKEKDPYTYD